MKSLFSSHHIRICAGLVLGMAGAGPIAAQTYMAALADGGVYIEGSTHPRVEVLDNSGWTEGTAPTGQLRASVSLLAPEPRVGTRGSFQSRAETALGGIHLYARAFAHASHSDLGLQTRANAGGNGNGIFLDSFALNVPGYAPGALFTVTGRVRIEGSSSHTADSLLLDLGGYRSSGGSRSYAGWESVVTLKRSGATTDLVALYDRGECAKNGSDTSVRCTGGAPGWRSFSFAMPNQSWSAKVSMSAWASAGAIADIAGIGSASADSVIDFGRTIAWDGITELRDATGALIADYSATSASSGFDYRNAYVTAVPEPNAVLLLLAGLAALGWVVQRRRA